MRVAAEPEGTVPVVDSVLDEIIRLAPSMGEQATISHLEAISGPDLILPQGIAVAGELPSAIDPADAIVTVVVTDSGRGAIVSVDTLTEERTIISEPETGSV